MKNTEANRVLREYAASQRGLFTAAQAVDIGISRMQLSRMKSDGRLEHIFSGVYRFAGSEADVYEGIRATWMSIEPKTPTWERLKSQPFDSVVAGVTASVLHGVGDFYETPYTFITQARKKTRRDDISFHSSRLAETDTEVICGLPVTTIERTISDLIRLEFDPSNIDNLISDCERKRVDIDEFRLGVLLSPLARRNGFKQNDGSAFAYDMMSRNIKNQSLYRLASYLKRINSRIDEARETLLPKSSPAFENVLQLQEKIGQALEPLRRIVEQNELLLTPFRQSARIHDEAAELSSLRPLDANEIANEYYSELVSAVNKAFNELSEVRDGQEQTDV